MPKNPGQQVPRVASYFDSNGRLSAEARAAAARQDPNIVKVVKAWHASGGAAREVSKRNSITKVERRKGA